MNQNNGTSFIGYEYKKITVPGEHVSFYADCYESFGWRPDDKIAVSAERGMAVIRLKRDRKMVNKMELTRLERNFEACAKEIDALERTKISAAQVWAISIGLIGTAFMAGSVFAVTHRPPLYLLCAVLAVPALIGWIAPYFVYRRKAEAQTEKVRPMIEAKQEEIYKICEKAHDLLKY